MPVSYSMLNNVALCVGVFLSDAIGATLFLWASSVHWGFAVALLLLATLVDIALYYRYGPPPLGGNPVLRALRFPYHTGFFGLLTMGLVYLLAGTLAGHPYNVAIGVAVLMGLIISTTFYLSFVARYSVPNEPNG